MKPNKRMGMRRFGAGLLFAVCLGAGGCLKREIANIGNGGASVVCFGDSLTYGYGVERGQDYPSVLSRLIEVPVVNAGVDSNSSAAGLSRMQKDVLSQRPYLVLIEFGANDFLQQVPIDVSVRNISRMIEAVQAQGSIAAVVDPSAGMVLREYRARLSRLAAEKGALFIPDVFHGILTNPSLKSDFVHPNAEGYRQIAERIIVWIRPYLARRSTAAGSGGR